MIYTRKLPADPIYHEISLQESISYTVLYTGKCSPPIYFPTFRPRCQWVKLRQGEFKKLKYSPFKQLYLGDFKVGRNHLQAKKGENNTGRK